MSENIRWQGVMALAIMLAVFTSPAQALAQSNDVCGGIAGLACGGGEYCHFKKGECRIPDMQGMCKKRPEACAAEYRPVCGCDGRTYSNNCAAAAAGTSVLHHGACREQPEQPRACGGIAGISCGGGEFCQFKTGECGIPDMQGACTKRPEVCTEEYLPVCGCDGKTYSNACHAAAAGANVLHKGECRIEHPQ